MLTKPPVERCFEQTGDSETNTAVQSCVTAYKAECQAIRDASPRSLR
jgi:hypothetical protein